MRALAATPPSPAQVLEADVALASVYLAPEAPGSARRVFLWARAVVAAAQGAADRPNLAAHLAALEAELAAAKRREREAEAELAELGNHPLATVAADSTHTRADVIMALIRAAQ